MMGKYLMFNDYCLDETKIYVADLSLAKNSYNTLHNHNFYEIFVVLKGEFKHIKNGKEELLKSRDFQIIRPEDIHQFKGVQTVNILRNIAIEKEYFEQQMSTCPFVQELDQIFTVSDTIYRAYLYKTNLIMSKRHQYTNYILESLFKDLMIEYITNKSERMEVPHWLKNACSKMNQPINFIEGLPRFIELSGMSQEHLTRALKKYYDETPTQFINNLRLIEASNQLINSHKSIIEIAFECGFENVSYFNRIFKQKFKVSPRTYRKNNQLFFS